MPNLGVLMNVVERRMQGWTRQGVGVIFAAVLLAFAVPLAAQPQAPQPAAPLSPEQLDDLVAPVALYPDPLLSQVLVASTYPLEIVEAAQWIGQNGGLRGQALMDAARQQNWDPSVQALAATPEVLQRLASNVSWTTALGNAFLAQQADVMAAVQRMRARAQANGRLSSDPEQTVTTQTQGGQSAIEIMPANPQVIYVPQYNPEYIWGPPLWGYYPDLWYPTVGFGFGFGPGIYLGSYFGGWGGWGWGGWGGWGWGPNWFGGSILLNAGFFGHYGFHNWGYGRFGGGLWAHNPSHRLGVAYPNQALGQRFGGNYIGRGGMFHAGAGVGAQRAAGFAGGQFRGGQSFARGAGSAGGWQRFGGATGAVRGGAFGGGQMRGGQSFAGAGGGQRFSGAASTARGGAIGGGQMRGGQSFAGGGGSYRSAPSYRSTPNFGGAMRAAPSYSGRSFGGGSRPAFSGGASRSFGGGGGGFHGGGGGGGFRGGGGHGRR